MAFFGWPHCRLLSLLLLVVAGLFPAMDGGVAVCWSFVRLEPRWSGVARSKQEDRGWQFLDGVVVIFCCIVLVVLFSLLAIGVAG